MTGRKPTVSVSIDRGQTTQDFAVGIGVFLLAIAFVFSFVPSLVTPFSSSVDSGDTAQADRIAAAIVENASDDPDRPNHLNMTKFNETAALSDEDLADSLGLRIVDGTLVDRVNVTIENVSENEETVLAGGTNYDNQSAASAARIVTLQDTDDCTPACRLVVRVW